VNRYSGFRFFGRCELKRDSVMNVRNVLMLIPPVNYPKGVF
jgi:hypothetical protein